MSDNGDGNPAPGGQGSPMDQAGALVWAAVAEDAVIHDPGPHGDDEAQAGLSGVAGAMGGLYEEAREAGVQGDSDSEEDSDIEPASEGEEDEEHPADAEVDASQFPMVGFRFMFLDLVRIMLHRLYRNDHLILPPRHSLSIVRSTSQIPARTHQIPMLSEPEGSGEGPAAMMPEGFGDGATVMVPEGSGEGASAPEAKDQPEAEVEIDVEEETTQNAEAPKETIEYQYEDSKEEVQDAETEEEKEEFNRKQEGSGKDVNSAESRPGKSSLEEL